MLEEIYNGNDMQVNVRSQDRIEKHVVQDANNATVEKYNIFTCSPSVEVDILNII